MVPKRSDHVYQRFQQQVIRFRKDGVKTIAAITQLARMVLAYPHPEKDEEAFKATYELAPAMMNTAASMAQTLGDADDKADEKK